MAARAVGNPAAAILDKTGFAPKRTLRRIGPPICSHVLWISGIIFKLVLESAEPRQRLSWPLVPGSVAIYGYVYDVKSGRLVEVPEATRVGSRKRELVGRS